MIFDMPTEWREYSLGDLIPLETTPIRLLAAAEPYTVNVGGRLYVDTEVWVATRPLRFGELWWLSLLQSPEHT